MHLVTEITIPPVDGLVSGTDYALVNNHMLYVAYSSANTLLKMDTTTLSIQSLITGINGIHGVTFSQDASLAFASAGDAAQIVVLRMPSGSEVMRVQAGKDPDGIVFDRKLAVAYAGNGGSNSATLLSANNLEHSTTVPLGGSPEFPQVDETTGLIYQPLEDTNEVVVVDPSRERVVSRFAVSPCKGPKGSAIDTERKVLFVGCSNRMLLVMDLETGRVVETVPIGRFVDVVAWDAGLQRIYTANSAGSMTVIGRSGQGSYSVLETVPTRAGGHTLAIDADTHKVYVICSGLHGAKVLVYEPASVTKS